MSFSCGLNLFLQVFFFLHSQNEQQGIWALTHLHEDREQTLHKQLGTNSSNGGSKLITFWGTSISSSI